MKNIHYHQVKDTELYMLLSTVQNFDTLKNLFKVACKVQIWKKAFCQNSDKFGYSFI